MYKNLVLYVELPWGNRWAISEAEGGQYDSKEVGGEQYHHVQHEKMNLKKKKKKKKNRRGTNTKNKKFINFQNHSFCDCLLNIPLFGLKKKEKKNSD